MVQSSSSRKHHVIKPTEPRLLLALFQGLQELSHPRGVLLHFPQPTVALQRHLTRGGILHYDHQVMPSATPRRVWREFTDDHMGFEPNDSEV